MRECSEQWFLGRLSMHAQMQMRTCTMSPHLPSPVSSPCSFPVFWRGVPLLSSKICARCWRRKLTIQLSSPLPSAADLDRHADKKDPRSDCDECAPHPGNHKLPKTKIANAFSFQHRCFHESITSQDLFVEEDPGG